MDRTGRGVHRRRHAPGTRQGILRQIPVAAGFPGFQPTRTIAGLRSFDQKVILIAGGYDKHIPYEPLAPEITAHVKNLVLMGATGPRIEKAVREDPNFNEAELPIQHADNMQHAVELARACAKPGDIIILSPASASFDLYPNFEVRGREFKSIVNALK